MNNIKTAVFNGTDTARVYGLWQWDYGQVLRIQGLSLDPAVEIHFSLSERGGESTPRIGVTQDGVTDVVIPDSMLENGGTTQDYCIYAWVYVGDETSGQTEKKITMCVKSRPKPKAFSKPEDAQLFREAIEVVNEYTKRSETSEKSAEAWAHGSDEFPERDNDNARYYAGQAKNDATQTQNDRNAVSELSEHVDTVAIQVDADKTEAGQYKEQASASATNALLSEQAAKSSETAAKEAQAGAESAEGNAEMHALDAAASASGAELAKTQAQENAQQASEDRDAVQKLSAGFSLTCEKAIRDINTAGENQVNAVDEAGQKALENIGTGIDNTLLVEGKAADAGATGKAVDELKGDLDKLNALNLTKTTGKNILNIDDIESGNFSSSGSLINSTSYSRTRNIIPVVEGETYSLQSIIDNPVKIKMRYVFAYNYDGEIVDSKQFVETYTVPIGKAVVGIKISIDNKYANESAGTMLSKGTETSQYEPYREIDYVDCGIKIKNAIDYDIIDDIEKDLKRSRYDFRYIDTACSEYSCATPYIANPGHQSVNVVYDMYDELMNKYPDYITKTLIGTIDDYGYEVYRYDFTPPVPISSTESDVCKILYCTGTHGEYPNIWVGIRFLRDLCDNWRSDKMLQCIRFGCHITAIPLVNPYGFVNNSRKNENGIDINRNFTNDWIFKTDDVNSIEYQGLAPASEKSTQIIETLCAGESFDFGIDHHIYGSFDASGMLGYFVNCLKKPENVSFANMYGLWANQKCMAENTLISDFSTSYFKTFTKKNSFDGYLYGTFENGILWESMTEWGNAEMEAVVESQKFNVECLAALIYSAMKHYRRY